MCQNSVPKTPCKSHRQTSEMVRRNARFGLVDEIRVSTASQASQTAYRQPLKVFNVIDTELRRQKYTEHGMHSCSRHMRNLLNTSFPSGEFLFAVVHVAERAVTIASCQSKTRLMSHLPESTDY